jgi:hypothetical protein
VSVIDSNTNGAAARWRVGQLAGVEDTGPFPGRHASRTEIAEETPIFLALTVGGWRGRRPEPEAPHPATAGRHTPQHAPQADPLTEFRRDPLTAPIPIQAYVAPPAPAVAAVRQPRRTPAVICASVSAVPTTPSPGAHARPALRGRHHQLVPGRPGAHRLR